MAWAGKALPLPAASACARRNGQRAERRVVKLGARLVRGTARECLSSRGGGSKANQFWLRRRAEARDAGTKDGFEGAKTETK
jgi:hypothetical protein